VQSIKDYAKRQKLRSNTQRGDSFEQDIAFELLAQGYVVDVTKINRSIRRGRWITLKADFFGAIDIIAMKPGVGPVLFIQATTARDIVSKKKRKIDDKLGDPADGRLHLVITRPASGVGFEIYQRTISGWAPPCVSDKLTFQ